MVWFFLNLFLLWRIVLECRRLLKLFPDNESGKGFPAWLGGGALAGVFGMACVAALMVSPMSRGQYFFLPLPALLFVPVWFFRRGQTSLAKVLVFVPVALVFFHYIFLPVTGRIGLLGIGTTLWFVFTAIQMIRLAGNKAVDLQPAPNAGHT